MGRASLEVGAGYRRLGRLPSHREGSARADRSGSNGGQVQGRARLVPAPRPDGHRYPAHPAHVAHLPGEPSATPWAGVGLAEWAGRGLHTPTPPLNTPRGSSVIPPLVYFLTILFTLRPRFRETPGIETGRLFAYPFDIENALFIGIAQKKPSTP